MDQRFIAPDSVKNLIELHILVGHIQDLQACMNLCQLAHFLRGIQRGHIEALFIKGQAVTSRAAPKIQNRIALFQILRKGFPLLLHILLHCLFKNCGCIFIVVSYRVQLAPPIFSQWFFP